MIFGENSGNVSRPWDRFSDDREEASVALAAVWRTTLLPEVEIRYGETLEGLVLARFRARAAFFVALSTAKRNLALHGMGVDHSAMDYEQRQAYCVLDAEHTNYQQPGLTGNLAVDDVVITTAALLHDAAKHPNIEAEVFLATQDALAMGKDIFAMTQPPQQF